MHRRLARQDSMNDRSFHIGRFGPRLRAFVITLSLNVLIYLVGTLGWDDRFNRGLGMRVSHCSPTNVGHKNGDNHVRGGISGQNRD